MDEGNVHAIQTRLEKGWNTDLVIQLLQPVTDGQKMKVILSSFLGPKGKLSQKTHLFLPPFVAIYRVFAVSFCSAQSQFEDFGQA